MFMEILSSRSLTLALKMIITQLVYIKEGKEQTYLQYEDIVIPQIKNYKGRILLRLRPDNKSVIQNDIEKPFEIHIVEFPSGTDLDNFMNDKVRREFFHLKEESVRSVITIRDDTAAI
jgi:hypothetical protein